MGAAFPASYFQAISVGTFTKGLGLAELCAEPPGPGRLRARVHRGSAACCCAARNDDARLARSCATSGGSACKELSSLRRDPVLVVLIVYTFTLAVYSVAAGANTEVRNAAVAIVDEDGSALLAPDRRRGAAALVPDAAADRPADAVDAAMDAGRYTFVLDVPPRFEADLLAGRDPTLQLSVDATAVTQAGGGCDLSRPDRRRRGPRPAAPARRRRPTRSTSSSAPASTPTSNPRGSPR